MDFINTVHDQDWIVKLQKIGQICGGWDLARVVRASGYQSMPKSQQFFARSQHPSTLWNLRAANEAVLNKYIKKMRGNWRYKNKRHNRKENSFITVHPKGIENESQNLTTPRILWEVSDRVIWFFFGHKCIPDYANIYLIRIVENYKANRLCYSHWIYCVYRGIYMYPYCLTYTATLPG